MHRFGVGEHLIRANRLDYWQDVVCRTMIEGECVGASARNFHGDIAFRRETDLGFSQLSSVAQRFVRSEPHIRRSQREFVILLLQLSDNGHVSQDGREATLAPSDFTFLDSTRPSTLGFDRDFEQLVVHIPRELIIGQFGRTERLTALPIRGDSAMGPILSSFLRNATKAVDNVSAATIERLSNVGRDLILATINEFATVKCEPSSWTRTALLYRAKAFIDAHMSDHALNPQAVAAALGISPRYLQALFHDEDTTPSEWIWYRRLDKSRRELKDTAAKARSISDIALACGFADFSHFSRRFTSAYGLSPRNYRAGGS